MFKELKNKTLDFIFSFSEIMSDYKALI